MIERIPHVEPLFDNTEFVSDYSQATKRYASADYEPILRFTLGKIESIESPQIIELGPGPGWCGIRLLQRREGTRLIGFDTSQAYVEMANQNAQEEGVGDRADFRLGNACELSEFDDASIDGIISSQSFHYWDEPVQALNEICRVLKPGGVFCVSADRRDLSAWASIVVAVTKWILPSSVRESWIKSFQGAFTIDEVENIVKQSHLRDEVELKITSRMYSIQGIKAHA